MMDRLWKVELAFEEDPASVSPENLELYQETMVEMVRQVLLGNKEGLITATPLDYAEFLSRLEGLKSSRR